MSHKFQKRWGQNFLKYDRYAEKLVRSLELTDADQVIEIGPGDGRVTKLLLQSGAQITSIEIDYSLLPNLIKRFGNEQNFELLHENVLNFTTEKLGKYKLTGSLPYNISKPILKKFLGSANRPEIISVIIQREVAEDYTAVAPKATFLSNWIRLQAEIELRDIIPVKEFYPQPKVDGAILTIKPHTKLRDDFVELTKLLRIGFTSPRKTLWNNLKNSRKYDLEVLEKAWKQLGLGEKLRAAELETQGWYELLEQLEM